MALRGRVLRRRAAAPRPVGLLRASQRGRPRAPAGDLVWQTACLIGLAARRYYRSRATVIADSLVFAEELGRHGAVAGPFKTLLEGYRELAGLVTQGRLSDRPAVYEVCERLWEGIDSWVRALGLTYELSDLPL
ncbi:MAG: hypothetical protein K6U08_01960 [Firmicutes bacterium]|nr:hypothetical protein [Bacillota bacterium]